MFQTWLPYAITSELQMLIKRSDWIDVSNFIHGPLGELRLKMTYGNLLQRPSAGEVEQRGILTTWSKVSKPLKTAIQSSHAYRKQRQI